MKKPREYVAANGTKFTDKDIEAWAKEAEEGFPNSVLEPVKLYEWEQKPVMRARTIRVPDSLWSLIDNAASKQGISPSAYVRQALTRSLIS